MDHMHLLVRPLAAIDFEEVAACMGMRPMTAK